MKSDSFLSLTTKLYYGEYSIVIGYMVSINKGLQISWTRETVTADIALECYGMASMVSEISQTLFIGETKLIRTHTYIDIYIYIHHIRTYGLDKLLDNLELTIQIKFMWNFIHRENIPSSYRKRPQQRFKPETPNHHIVVLSSDHCASGWVRLMVWQIDQQCEDQSCQHTVDISCLYL